MASRPRYMFEPTVDIMPSIEKEPVPSVMSSVPIPNAQPSAP